MGRKIRIEMAGRRYGRLVGLEYAYSEGGHAYWLFSCDCGMRTIAKGTAVRAGRTASCGCLHREICAERLTKHGRRAKKRHDPTYRAWQAMNSYCSNPTSHRYRDFGALGIAVCCRWRGDFDSFLEDMGERLPGSILGRFDTEKGFAPGNCYWLERKSRSRRAVEGHDRRRSLERFTRGPG